MLLVTLRRAGRVGADRTPERRWATVFHSCAARLLDLLLDVASTTGQWLRLEDFLAREFLDPNRSRARNLSVSWA